ncbi:MAG: carboxypeptidase regulatory-like domain-containing protein [Planctomycetes bacterium]|nr:carboxypeptidase regulatory-like domain-containing protein [Planctomycetota bacterium]
MHRRARLGLRIAAVVTVAAGVAAAQAGGERLLGLVRDANGRAVVGASVRIFPLPELAVAWRDPAPSAALQTTTDRGGRFAVALDRRAALWIEHAGTGAFLAAAAPGVPVVVTLRALAAVDVGPRTRGAYVRLDGVPVGYVPSAFLPLPGRLAELLVERKDLERVFVAGCELSSGERGRVRCPRNPPSRLAGVPIDGFATLPPWPERRFLPDGRGEIELPITARPQRVRLAMPTDRAGEFVFEEVWLEPGRVHRAAPAAASWRAVQVVDRDGQPLVGASVFTVRTGPGLPVVVASSVSDDAGRGRCRVDVDNVRIVAVAADHALASAAPIGDPIELRLEPANALRLRVVDADGQPLPDALVTVGTDPELSQSVRTDLRGGALLQRLPAGELAVAVEHPDRVARAFRVAVPTTAVVECALASGLELRGVVACADRSDLTDVLVEVRARGRADGFRSRLAPVAADGSFVVRGLAGEPVDLFARCVDRGVTWSGNAVGVAPGGDPVTITIRCDDPVPGGEVAGGGR